MSGSTALVICPTGDASRSVERKLAGLTVGERLLVAFLGVGPRPESARAEIEIFEPTLHNGPAEGEDFLLLPADLVFERSLVRPGAEPAPDLPLRRMPASAWKAVLADPEGFLGLLGLGRLAGPGNYALRVYDSHSVRAAKRGLFGSLTKSVDGIVARYLNRHVSLIVTRMLVGTGVTPNQLTVAILPLGLAAGVAAAFAEHWWMLLLAGLLLQLQSILDGCDGEIARLTYRYSKLGQWLDTIGDDLTNYCFCLGLAIGQARVLDVPWWYAVGGAVFALQWATSLIMYQRMFKLGTGDMTALPNLVTQKNPSGFKAQLLRVGRIVTKRDFFVFIIALFTAVQLPLVAFLTAAVGTVPAFLGVLGNELKLRKLIAQTGDQSRLPDSSGEV
ncbi:MAG: CDP-alcohol phosphatidyltransferase family protein [Deltaproteobacteria bacterium]|nr:CDP-alcohol phosphatidyltransferase family protein [Deltaproteobacteria bacterium]